MTTGDVHEGIKSEYRFDNACLRRAGAWRPSKHSLTRTRSAISKRSASARDGTAWRLAAGAARSPNGDSAVDASAMNAAALSCATGVHLACHTWTLHQLRHAALTHAAEDGTNTPIVLARSRHASVRSLERFARPALRR